MSKKRVAVYIDGFNFYYAIVDYLHKTPFSRNLKWLDYKQLIESNNGRKFIKISKEWLAEEKKNRSIIDQKNDKIYKTLLSLPKERRIYINRVYHRNLKEDEIEIYDIEIIGKRANLLRADMVFKEKGKNVFYHIEQPGRDYLEELTEEFYGTVRAIQEIVEYAEGKKDGGK